MAITKLSLPLGLPAAGPSAAYLTHLGEMLTPDGNTFLPSNIAATFTLSPLATEEDKVLRAIWDGQYTIMDGVITGQLPPDANLELLMKTKAENWPIPKTVVYGTTDAANAVLDLKAGDPIGNLISDQFTIEFRDGNGYYLNPYTYFKLLKRLEFFSGENAWPLPFSRAIVPDFPEIVFATGSAADPYVEIRGGSMRSVLFNPNTTVPENYFSFITSDRIQINVQNLQAGITARIEIRNGINPVYQPDQVTIFRRDTNNLNFVPQDDLRPFHLEYDSTVGPWRRRQNEPYVDFDGRNGSKDPGKPLKYLVNVLINNISVCQGELQQDQIDIIRQEYVFHSFPFQDDATNTNPHAIQARVLTIPGRSNIQRVQFKSDFFTPEPFMKSNYPDWIIDMDRALNVAELMRRRFVNQMLEIMDTGILPVPDTFASFDLRVNSAWRNPERNEAVGGVQTSNHQFGRALDLAAENTETTTSNPNNVTLHYALFKAGRSFLADMVNLHGADRCRSMEILLERETEMILSYELDAAGNIQLIPKGAYNKYSNNPPTGDELGYIVPVADNASHVHIGWNSNNATPLTFPAVPPYDEMNFVPLLDFKNIILVAAEGDDIAANDQLPLYHVANTIKEYLDSMPGGKETLILDVSDPIEFLEAIGAIGPYCRINYFFSLSHAWPYGIRLKHQAATPEGLDIKAKMRQVYGADITFDRDDFTTFQIDQFRVSNIRFLPSGMVRTLRSVFRQANGVFFLGCNTGNTQDTIENTFCEEFASMIGRPVFGAGYYSKVFEFDGVEWKPVTINRSAPVEPEHQYVLAPNELGTFQYLKYLKEHGLPENFHPSGSSDLFEFYRESLEILFPDPNFDHQSGQSVEEMDLQEPELDN